MSIIYTLDARDNMLLPIVTKEFNLSTKQLFAEINSSFMQLKQELSAIDLQYKELKSALVPNKDKNEIVLVFDTSKINRTWYSLEIFEKVIPIFNKKSSHSVLCGDYIGNNQESMKAILLHNLTVVNEFIYKHSTQFFLVYINNVSTKMIEGFDKGLRDYAPYIGHLNLKFSSILKTYLSMILVKSFIKQKNNILMSTEEDFSETEQGNLLGFPFEDNGFKCFLIKGILYDLFLSYKIEREIIDKDDEGDVLFSLISMDENTETFFDYKIVIEDNKFEYLSKVKLGSLKKSGLYKITKNKLEKIIQEKLRQSYIYNIEFLKDYNVLKFNIIIEVSSENTNVPNKLLLSLEYKTNEKNLRLITLY